MIFIRATIELTKVEEQGWAFAPEINAALIARVAKNVFGFICSTPRGMTIYADRALLRKAVFISGSSLWQLLDEFGPIFAASHCDKRGDETILRGNKNE
jgi:hypothetical protein